MEAFRRKAGTECTCVDVEATRRGEEGACHSGQGRERTHSLEPGDAQSPGAKPWSQLGRFGQGDELSGLSSSVGPRNGITVREGDDCTHDSARHGRVGPPRWWCDHPLQRQNG